MDDRRVRLESRIQQLIDAGKTPDEIRGMKDQLRAEMASPEGGARQQLGPTPAGAPDPEAYRPAPMNPLEAQDASREAPGFFRQAGRLLAGIPGEVESDPGNVPRALATGGANAATLGMAKDLHGPAIERMRAKAAAGKLSPDDLQVISMWQDAASPGRQRTPIVDPAAALDELAGVHQQTQERTSRMPGTQFAGGLIEAPATLPGRVAGVVGGRVGGAATGIAERALPGALARPVGAAVGSAAGGASASATSDLATGNVEGMGDRALETLGPSAAMGFVPALVGEGLQGFGNVVKNSKGGRARQAVEAVGGSVSPISSGSGGEFAPGGRLEGMTPTDRDIGRVSRTSSANVLRGMENDLQGDLAPALAKKAAIDATAKGHVVVNDLVTAMEELKQGEVLSPGEMDTVEKWLQRLDKYEVKTPDGEGTGVYAMRPKQLNNFRGMLQRQTGTGQDPGTVSEANMQKVAGVAKGLVDQTDYADVNAQISGARSKYEGKRRLLGLNDRQAGGPRSPEDLPNSEINRVTNMMARQGQNTVTAGGQNTAVPMTEEGAPLGDAQERLALLAQQNPQYARDIAMPEALAAKGDLKYRLLPDTGKGGFIERAKAMGPAAAAVLGAGAAGATGNPALSAGLGLLGLAAINRVPIQGRLMYRPALMAGGVGEGLSAAAPYAGMLLNPLQADEQRRSASNRSEAEFQRWYAGIAAKNGIDPNPDNPEHHYDYRAFYRDLVAGRQQPPGSHFPSEYKTAGHPREYLRDSRGRIFSTVTGTYQDGSPVPAAELERATNAPTMEPQRKAVK